MLDKDKVALLWIIRESKDGISVYELREQVEARTIKLPATIELFQMPGLFNRSVEKHIQELLNLNLIKTQNGKDYHIRSRLIVTPMLYQLQDLFGISLTASLTQSQKTIVATPIFEPPKPKSPQWARVFVAMPFADPLKPIYYDHIAKVASALEVSCKRADNLFGASQIIHDVWSAIYHADVLIVDCTGRNPNVFYELGIAHTLGRKCILITQSVEDIPFDIRGWRVIVYTYTPPGMAQFETDLEKTLRAELGL